jgi:hypothetical protein
MMTPLKTERAAIEKRAMEVHRTLGALFQERGIIPHNPESKGPEAYLYIGPPTLYDSRGYKGYYIRIKGIFDAKPHLGLKVHVPGEGKPEIQYVDPAHLPLANGISAALSRVLGAKPIVREMSSIESQHR